jgi:hypothetical protein
MLVIGHTVVETSFFLVMYKKLIYSDPFGAYRSPLLLVVLANREIERYEPDSSVGRSLFQ